MDEETNSQKSIDGELSYHVLGMEKSQFREAAHKMVDVILDYHQSLESGKRSALPDVKPGFMRQRVEAEAPLEGEKWQNVFKDIERVVFDGSTHWQSANNFGYFPTAIGYPGILADFLIGAAGQLGFTWFSSPACTELEIVMMDWLAKALDLPECFIHGGKGPGGGVIQGTASEATLMALLTARTKMIQQEQTRDPNQSIHEITHRMVAYASKCSHSSVVKASMIAMVDLRLLDAGEDASLRGETLREAIEEDLKKGKLPLYVCATLGTTYCCTSDDLEGIGNVCEEYNLWLHVDAAYAGSALLCPEFRYLGKGLERVTSFLSSPHKWMMTNFDCSALWVRNAQDIENSLKMNPVYLHHDEQHRAIDYMHWQIPLSRRFRSIKLWFTMRMVGVEGLRHHIRAGVARGKFFGNLVRSDERFEILFPDTLGLVCFRMVTPGKSKKELNDLNRELNQRIKADRTFHATAAELNNVYFLRVSTGTAFCSNDSLERFWELLKTNAGDILKIQT